MEVILGASGGGIGENKNPPSYYARWVEK